jgi:hypothetical protein
MPAVDQASLIDLSQHEQLYTAVRKASRQRAALRTSKHAVEGNFARHYLRHRPAVQRPTAAQMGATRVPHHAHAKPLPAHAVVFAVLASCALPSRLLQLDRTWCGSHHEGVQCVAYTDCELGQQSLSWRTLRHVRLVPPSEYTDASLHALPRGGCCDPSVDINDPLSYDGQGPVSFFCNSTMGKGEHQHRITTLHAQYRFLPALEHAKRRHHARLVRGALGGRLAEQSAEKLAAALWLVLVDDDSWINMHNLLSVLARYRASEPLQLGEFIEPIKVNATHWKRPFACGGAGTVLSAAAVMAMDFDHCLRAFNNTCQQSDWMIGKCAERYGVLPMTELGCGGCARAPTLTRAHTLAQALHRQRRA